MKKSIFIILPLILLGVSFSRSLFKTQPADNNIKTDTLGAVNSSATSLEVVFDGKTYLVNYFKIDNISNLELLTNFNNKLTSSEVFENNNCRFLSSAGFYSKNIEPIGYFKNTDGLIGKWQENKLLNGILSVNDFDTPRISRGMPKDNLRIGLQSGPLLIENLVELDLSLEFDEEARRMVAIVTGENNLIFMVIRSNESGYTGPYLKDLTSILIIIEAKTDEVFADAINLDGGSASAFISQDVRLPEAVMSGSFFCLH